MSASFSEKQKELNRLKYVIVGNGVAGTTAAAFIRKTDPQGSITILTEEPYPFYSRIRLTEFLAGAVDEQGLVIRKELWYEENRIRLLINTHVTGVDIEAKKIVTATGGAVQYDRLLLATGASSFVPPVPGAEKKGVFTLRTLQDAIAIKNYVKDADKRIVLIGGGILGLEAGNSLRKTGNHITVVESYPRLLPRQMDPSGADILRLQMEIMGFRFCLGAESKEITGRDRAEGLLPKDGRLIDCDMILISAGIRPNTSITRHPSLEAGKGLIVNDKMETGIPDVYAAGDLVEHNSICYGIWPAAEKQGETAGINMAGGNEVYRGTVISNVLKVAGIDLMAAGDIDAAGKGETIVLKDSDNFIYKKIVLRDNLIIGAILYGDIKDRKKILRAIENRTDISGIRKDLDVWNLKAL
jgi:nitrite reductase (NADH) large subunit